MDQRADVVVIGAGPAGSAATGVLRQAGLSVVVLEKHHFPRPVIGESLLPRAMQALQEAGLLDSVLDRGYQRKEGAVFLRGQARAQFAFSDQYTTGWDHALQVPRAAFDHTLAKRCVALGADVRFGCEVVDVAFGAEETTVAVRDDAGQSTVVRCRFVIDASGYGRVLPRLLGLAKTSTQRTRKSLFSWVKARPDQPTPVVDAAIEGAAWVCMLPGGGWLWMIPFADGQCSVGVVAEPAFYAAWPADPEAALRAILASDPNTAARFPDPEFAFAPQTIQGYSGESTQLFGAGYCLVGNALGFLDPVFSSGVTVALVSAVCAAELVVRELGGEAVDWQADYAGPMLSGVDVFRTYVDAWYAGRLPELFFADVPSPVIKRQICSVLAGYVWDASNPLVAQASRKLSQVQRLIGGVA